MTFVVWNFSVAQMNENDDQVWLGFGIPAEQSPKSLRARERDGMGQ